MISFNFCENVDAKGCFPIFRRKRKKPISIIQKDGKIVIDIDGTTLIISGIDQQIQEITRPASNWSL